MLYWLKDIREEKKLTQEQVAVAAGIGRSTYGHIESSERGVTVSNAKKIAKVLGFDWTQFFKE